jgi:ferritin-like metal-binding protein YciE
MATADERLDQWLRDAHAMEEQAEQMLSATSSRLEHYPQLKARLDQHLAETRNQAAMLSRCIERRGTSTSTLKDLAGKVTAMAQGLSGLFVGDEVVKGSMASYTFEHMEIASYKVLIATAEEAGDTETASVCRTILREEEAMATWLADNLDPITRQYIAREETPGLTAKH